MVMPISGIVVTLATRAYVDLLKYRAYEFSSPIEVVLAVVEVMPNHIERGLTAGVSRTGVGQGELRRQVEYRRRRGAHRVHAGLVFAIAGTRPMPDGVRVWVDDGEVRQMASPQP